MNQPDPRRRRRTWLGLLVLAGTPAAVAQVDDPPVDVDDMSENAPALPTGTGSSFTIDVTAAVWIPRLNGDSRFGEGFGVKDIDLEDEMDLDGSETSFNPEVTIRFLDVWSVRASGYQFSTDDTGVFVGDARFGSLTLLPGDEYKSSFDIDSYALEVGYDVWHPLGDELADLRVTLIGGARYLEVEHEIETVAGRETGEGDWVALYVGAEFAFDLRPQSGLLKGRRLQIGAGVAFGADVNGDNGLYTQIRGGVAVEVVPHVDLNLGYRLLYADFTDDDYTFSGGLRGLFVGATVRF